MIYIFEGSYWRTLCLSQHTSILRLLRYISIEKSHASISAALVRTCGHVGTSTVARPMPSLEHIKSNLASSAIKENSRALKFAPNSGEHVEPEMRGNRLMCHGKSCQYWVLHAGRRHGGGSNNSRERRTLQRVLDVYVRDS